MPCQRPRADQNQPLTAAQTASWEGATSIGGDYLRRSHQCTACDRVPCRARFNISLEKLPAAIPDLAANTGRDRDALPKKHSAAAPHACHMRHDHGAARPVFLNIGRVADPNGVRAGIIARINIVGFGLVAGINTKPPRRTGRLRGWLLGRDLRGSRALLRRSLRFGAASKQRKCARSDPQYCPFPNAHGDARPNSMCGPTVSDCSGNVNRQETRPRGGRGSCRASRCPGIWAKAGLHASAKVI